MICGYMWLGIKNLVESCFIDFNRGYCDIDGYNGIPLDINGCDGIYMDIMGYSIPTWSWQVVFHVQNLWGSMFWGMVQIFRGLSHPFGRMILPSGYLLHSHGKSAFLIGKPSINGPFRMGMLNNHSVMILCVSVRQGTKLWRVLTHTERAFGALRYLDLQLRWVISSRHPWSRYRVRWTSTLW